MKIIFITLVFSFTFLSFNNVRAQEGSYLGLEFGVSLPSGDFGSNEYNSSYSGYATSGFLMGLIGNYQFSEYFGFAYAFRFQSNDFDSYMLERQLDLYEDLNSSEVFSSSYFLTGGMFGLNLTVPLSERFSWDSKVTLGWLSASKPYVGIVSSDGFDVIKVESEEATSVAFALAFGTAVKFDILEHFALIGRIESLFSSASYYFTESYYVNNQLENISSTSYTQSITTTNVTLGLLYRFNINLKKQKK